MRHYHVYKKLFSFILLGFFIITPCIFLHAQNAQDLQNKISQRNIDIAKLEQEIAQYQNQLDDIGKQKSSLNSTLKELDINRKKLVANITVTQNKIDNTNLKIQNLSSDINTKQDSISNDMKAISFSIKQINEFDNHDMIQTLVTNNKFTSIWNDVNSLMTIQEKVTSTITELKQIKGQLEDTKKQTTSARDDLVSLKSQLADQKKIVDQNTAEKKKLLTQTKNNESNYQKLLKDRLNKKDAFEKDIRDYESQLKYNLNSSILPGKGVLSWPLDKITITQLFGKTEAGKRLYANGTHNGVDFRASVGTPVYAMADGVVAGTGDTDVQCPGVSFGRFVLIKYDNGLASTFGHFSLIKVTKGQRVSRGEVVGYSGSTGYVTGPHLHVSVYARDAVDLKTLPSKSCPGRVLTQPISPINAYLDPLYYLPSI